MTQIKDGPFEKMEEEAKRNQAMLQTKVGQTKADWLRSEIEKLKDAKLPLTPAELVGIPNTQFAEMRETHNTALTSIITRYKEELKVLET